METISDAIKRFLKYSDVRARTEIELEEYKTDQEEDVKVQELKDNPPVKNSEEDPIEEVNPVLADKDEDPNARQSIKVTKKKPPTLGADSMFILQ